MKIGDFKKSVNTKIKEAKRILEIKSNEYSRADRLSNFKKIALFRNKTPEDVLFSLVAKHIAALDDFIQDIEDNKVQPAANWSEKITDIITYMLLLNAMIDERLEKLEG